MGEKSWEYWHDKHDSSTRFGDLLCSDERAGMSHVHTITDYVIVSACSSASTAPIIPESDSQSDSQPDEMDAGPTDDESSKANQRNIVSNQVMSPQFFVKIKGRSKPCNIELSANMDRLVEIVIQVTGIPREYLKISIAAASSGNMWTNSNSGSRVVYRGFWVCGRMYA
jgi:hypothetical protein